MVKIKSSNPTIIRLLYDFLDKNTEPTREDIVALVEKNFDTIFFRHRKVLKRAGLVSPERFSYDQDSQVDRAKVLSISCALEVSLPKVYDVISDMIVKIKEKDLFDREIPSIARSMFCAAVSDANPVLFIADHKHLIEEHIGLFKKKDFFYDLDMYDMPSTSNRVLSEAYARMEKAEKFKNNILLCLDV